MRDYVHAIRTSLTQKLPVDNAEKFCHANYKCVRYSYFHIAPLPVADPPRRGLSLSTTLVSRMMLRLRSGGTRRHCDSRVTVQTTVLTLSELSGELSSVAPTMMSYYIEDDSEL